MFKKTKNFVIYYGSNEDFISKLSNNLEDKLTSVLSFFEIEKLNKKIIIKIISNKNEFDDIFYKVHNFKPDLNAMGFYHNGEIIYLSYNGLAGTNHKNDSYETYINILIHECVHFIHGIITNDKMSLRSLNEGIALYLGKQYNEIDYAKFNCELEDLLNQKNIDYYNYYLLMCFLIDNYEKNYILKILKDSNYAYHELENIVSNLKKNI